MQRFFYGGMGALEWMKVAQQADHSAAFTRTALPGAWRVVMAGGILSLRAVV